MFSINGAACSQSARPALTPRASDPPWATVAPFGGVDRRYIPGCSKGARLRIWRLVRNGGTSNTSESREVLIVCFGNRSSSTRYANRDRTVSERFADTSSSARLVNTAACCQPEDRRDFGVDFSSTSAIRVCQPGPVAFQLAITSGGNRSDSSRRGCCNFGRPRRTSFSPRYKSAPAIHSSVISGGSLVTIEVRTEPFRFALMTMPHADDAPGRTARCPDEHNQS